MTRPYPLKYNVDEPPPMLPTFFPLKNPLAKIVHGAPSLSDVQFMRFP